MELGIYSFGDSMPDAATGERIDQGTRIRNLLEEIEVAEDRKSTRLNSVTLESRMPSSA